MREMNIEKNFPNLIFDYHDEIEIFLSDLEKDVSWLSIAEQLQEDFKTIDLKEYSKLEKIFDKSLDIIGKDERYYRLTHLEIIFFLYQFWKKINNEYVLYNKNKLESLDFYLNKFDQSFIKYKKTGIIPIQNQKFSWWKAEIGSWWSLFLILLIIRFMLNRNLIQTDSLNKILEVLFWGLLITVVWKGSQYFYNFKKNKISEKTIQKNS